MSWHPCVCTTCCENVGGECYGGGCRLNPEPAPERDEDETENEEED